MPQNSSADESTNKIFYAVTITLSKDAHKLFLSEQYENTLGQMNKFMQECFTDWEYVVELTKRPDIHYHGYGCLRSQVKGKSVMLDGIILKIKDRLKAYKGLGFSVIKLCNQYKDGLNGWRNYMYKDITKTHDVLQHKVLFKHSDAMDKITQFYDTL